MKNPARALVVPTVLLLALGLVACGGDDGDSSEPKETVTQTVSDTPTETASETPTETATDSPTDGTEPTTIPEYLTQQGVQQTLIKRGDATAPQIDLPVPAGWTVTDEYANAASYGAIVYKKAANKSDPPRVLAILARLEGDVDPAKILQYAPGELEALDNYTPISTGDAGSLDGYDAVQLGGTYTEGSRSLVIAQKTVVIPAEDALYVLQLNAYAPEDEAQILIDATNQIDSKTTISAS